MLLNLFSGFQRVGFASLPACPPHHCDAGTSCLTASTCMPHPAQVVFPHWLHRTARHMLFPFVVGESGLLVRRNARALFGVVQLLLPVLNTIPHMVYMAHVTR